MMHHNMMQRRAIGRLGQLPRFLLHPGGSSYFSGNARALEDVNVGFAEIVFQRDQVSKY